MTDRLTRPIRVGEIDGSVVNARTVWPSNKTTQSPGMTETTRSSAAHN